MTVLLGGEVVMSVQEVEEEKIHPNQTLQLEVLPWRRRTVQKGSGLRTAAGVEPVVWLAEEPDDSGV